MMNLALLRPTTRILALLLLTACSLGCGRVHQVYWAQDSFDNPSGTGFHYDRLHLAPDAGQAIAGKTVRVEVADPALTINMAKSKLTQPVDWAAWRVVFENLLADRLHQSRVFGDVSASIDPYPIVQPDLIFRVALTEIHEGNAFLRYFPGFGMGATRLQWEGEMTRARAPQGTDPRVFAFADARIHPGGPSFFLSLKPLRGQLLIAEDLRFAINEMVGSLRRLVGEERPELYPFHEHNRSGPGRAPLQPSPPPVSQ